MLWLTKNAMLLPGGSVTAASQNLYFPASNLTSLLAADVWKSGVVAATDVLTITFDRVYKNAVDGASLWLVIKDHNLAASCSAVTYTWVSGFAETPVAISLAGGTASILLNIPFSNATRLYTGLTINFTKKAAANSIQVGKVFVGVGYDTTAVGDPDFSGFSRSFAEQVNKEYSIGRQKFAEAKGQYWAGTVNIPLITETIQATHRAILADVGTFKPFYLVVNQPAGTLGELGIPRYCTLASPATEGLKGFGTQYLWTLSLSLEEQL